MAWTSVLGMKDKDGNLIGYATNMDVSDPTQNKVVGGASTNPTLTEFINDMRIGDGSVNWKTIPVGSEYYIWLTETYYLRVRHTSNNEYYVESNLPGFYGVLSNGVMNQFYFTVDIDDTNKYAIIGYVRWYTPPNYSAAYTVLSSTTVSEMQSVYNIIRRLIPIDKPNPYEGGGYSGEGGGEDQNFNEQSDIIAEPSLPTFSATGSGMVSAYVPTLAEMNDIADYLIDPNLIQSLAGTVLKLSDVILGLNLFPFSVPASQSKQVMLNLMGAHLSTGITCHYADNQFVSLDMGSIQIEKCWDNCLDYNPYTQISIYLPFCGYYELDTDEIMGKSVNVKYKIDIMTGSCVALISVDGTIMYQFAGQCASQIPVSSVSFDGMISSMIDLGMTMASGHAALSAAKSEAGEAGEAFLLARSDADQRSLAGAVESARKNKISVEGAVGRQLMGATANAILGSKGFYSHAGGLSSAPGFLSVRKPFIIKKIPRQSVPEGYGKLRGFPSNISSKLGDLSGYTEVEDIHLNIPNATVAEIAECESILKAGCYL